MALKITRPQGTEDITPENISKWYTVEQVARDTAKCFGFHEMRIPTFESTDLFLRSVGETTDVVQKEMYTVKAKETEFTLRPEGTAGTIRSMLQNGMLNAALPQKVFYILSCFRHERPQAGRLRNHQSGKVDFRPHWSEKYSALHQFHRLSDLPCQLSQGTACLFCSL